MLTKTYLGPCQVGQCRNNSTVLVSLILSAGHGGEREHAQAPPQRDEGDPGGRGPEVGGS